ncbi:hypothetical protein E2C01_088505 [Portunus trituberculatus]|uniref:Uncharacterized protein n=1 Tax=Portunus trituberculatus TaxID=210409 RepID=A0A5B7JEV0_PORTR|nr:hypothetical protein [Portunus trituberculatus]
MTGERTRSSATTSTVLRINRSGTAGGGERPSVRITQMCIIHLFTFLSMVDSVTGRGKEREDEGGGVSFCD